MGRAAGPINRHLCYSSSTKASAPNTGGMSSPKSLPTACTTALKEWNVAIEALHRGEQTILLRKGGIREPLFKPPGTEFFLFPTAFHSEAQLLKPGMEERYAEAMALEPKQLAVLPLTTFVQVTGAWQTEDTGLLTALDDLHIWTPAFVEARLKWRARQPLTLLELRAWRLPQPLQLQIAAGDFWGCFSFVDLAPGLDSTETARQLAGAQPALSDAEFAQRQKVLRERLARVAHTPLVL